jgi:bisphosphoglycerate-dependent phosphoglycerate mutase
MSANRLLKGPVTPRLVVFPTRELLEICEQTEQGWAARVRKKIAFEKGIHRTSHITQLTLSEAEALGLWVELKRWRLSARLAVFAEELSKAIMAQSRGDKQAAELVRCYELPFTWSIESETALRSLSTERLLDVVKQRKIDTAKQAAQPEPATEEGPEPEDIPF